MPSEPYIGEIFLFAGNFAPRGYAFCQGQLLSIAQNTALFSILGTTYGGNGQTTFGLPDLRGRFPMHPNQGPGLSNHTLGEMSGTETVTLTTNQMPSHIHAASTSVPATNNPGAFDSPGGHVPARTTGGSYGSAGTDPLLAAPTTVSAAGGSQPHENMPPYLCLNYCIALEGIYPSRN